MREICVRTSLGTWRFFLAFVVVISHLWAGMIDGPAAYAVWGFFVLRRRPTISASGRDAGRDAVVPLGMERVALDIDACHLLVADFYPLGVNAAVEFASYDQTGLGRGGGDQFHHRPDWSAECRAKSG
jgi:hypothetical protein